MTISELLKQLASKNLDPNGEVEIGIEDHFRPDLVMSFPIKTINRHARMGKGGIQTSYTLEIDLKPVLSGIDKHSPRVHELENVVARLRTRIKRLKQVDRRFKAFVVDSLKNHFLPPNTIVPVVEFPGAPRVSFSQLKKGKNAGHDKTIKGQEKAK